MSLPVLKVLFKSINKHCYDFYKKEVLNTEQTIHSYDPRFLREES